MAKKNQRGQAMRAPRECVKLMYWQGTQVKPGEVYGVDEKGPYVTDKTMYKGFMSFRRPSVDNPLFWSACKEPKSAETVRQILSRWVSVPPVKLWKKPVPRKPEKSAKTAPLPSGAVNRPALYKNAV